MIIKKQQLKGLVVRQIKNNFFLDEKEEVELTNLIDISLLKTGKCFKQISNKYYVDINGECIFNPFHSGQYSIFLYFLSRDVWINGNSLLADRVYYLNKIMNGLDLFYEVVMPDIFFLEHPVGSVVGRATYENFFSFQQNCTVGGNRDIYPTIGRHVRMFANSSIIGNSVIGDNVFVSAGCMIKNENIPNNTIVFGSSPNLILKNKPTEYFYALSPYKVNNIS